MKNPLKKLICLLLPVTVVLSSCGEAGSSEALTDYRPNISIAQEDFDDLEFEDAKEVYFENPDILCNTYKDVDPDFVITLEGKGHTLTETPGYEDFTLSDTRGEAVEHTSLLTGSGGLTVTAKDGYKPGQAYVLTLNNDNLRFDGRAPSRTPFHTPIDDYVAAINTPTTMPVYYGMKAGYYRLSYVIDLDAMMLTHIVNFVGRRSVIEKNQFFLAYVENSGHYVLSYSETADFPAKGESFRVSVADFEEYYGQWDSAE